MAEAGLVAVLGPDESVGWAVELGAVNFQDRRSGEKALLKEIRSLLKAGDGEGETCFTRPSPPWQFVAHRVFNGC